jgi:hypothetical protein
MLKKYALISMFGLVLVLALSAAVPGPESVIQQYQYGPKSSVTGFLAPAPQYQYGPKSSVTGFLAPAPQYQYGPKFSITGFLASSYTNWRFAHTWNGVFIPSVDVTAFVAEPVKTVSLLKWNSGH